MTKSEQFTPVFSPACIHPVFNGGQRGCSSQLPAPTQYSQRRIAAPWVGVGVGRGGGVLKAVLSVTRTENLVYFYHVNQDRSSNLHQYSEEVLD